MSTPAGTHRGGEARAGKRGPWLVDPVFDLLFLANVTWPLVFLLEYWGGFEARDGIRFWQVYFVTTPHRWITLALVFFDGERMREHGTLYGTIALVAAAFCLTVNFTTGTLTCLMAVDYVWNAWHFAAQHHGVYRIYGSRCEPQRVRGLRLEKVAMRTFLLYTTLRIAGGRPWSDPAWNSAWESALHYIDYVMFVIPAAMVVREAWTFERARWGRAVYLASVFTLYGALLTSVHLHNVALTFLLTTASALFHATEYLAIVTWAVHRKHGRGTDRATLFAALVPRWGLALGLFAVILGLGGWMMEQNLMQTWLLLNTIAAFLHYTYDAMIWKVRNPHSYAA